MNVVIVNDFAYVDGGASQIALGSAKGLARRGHCVTLFTGVGPVDEELSGVDGIKVICLQQHDIVNDPIRVRAMINGLWNGKAAVEFERHISNLNRTDTVVHVHTWTKALSSSVIRGALDQGFAVVLTLHDYFSVCPTGGFFIHPTRQLCQLRPMSAACVSTNCDSRSYGHKLWRVGRQWIQSRAGHLPSHIKNVVSISALSERVIAPYLADDVRIHRVGNFIDLEREPAVNAGSNEMFSFAGRLAPEKGPELLAECGASLSFPLQFIGDGPLKEKLVSQLPHAVFTGWVTQREVSAALRKSRALVLPSLWYETQGLVVSEAAAIGVPAIVPSTSAACEWVEDGVTGLIFKGGDATDLGRKIAYLRDKPEAATTMGLSAYERYWSSSMTAVRHCKQLETVYRQILAHTDRR